MNYQKYVPTFGVSSGVEVFPWLMIFRRSNEVASIVLVKKKVRVSNLSSYTF